MALRDSQISTRSLFLKLLFTPVDYMFVICLAKCLSWLLRVWLRAYSTIWFCIIVSLLFYCFEDVIPLWQVAWALGMKKWLKSQGAGTNLDKMVPERWLAGLWECTKVPGRWHAHIMRASKGKVIKNFSGTQGQAAWSIGMVLMGLVYDVEVMYVVSLSIPFH